MLLSNFVPNRTSSTCNSYGPDSSMWLCASLPQFVTLQGTPLSCAFRCLLRVSSRHAPCIKDVIVLKSASRILDRSPISAGRKTGAIRCIHHAEEVLMKKESAIETNEQERQGLLFRHVERGEVAAVIADLRRCVPESSIGTEAFPNIEIFLSLGADAGQLRKMVRQNPALLGYDASVKILPLILVFHKFDISQENIMRCMAGNWRSCSVQAAQAESVLLYMRDELGVADVSKVLIGMSTILGVPIPSLRKKASFLRDCGVKHVGKLLARNSGCLNPSIDNIAEKIAFIRQLCDFEDIGRLVTLDPTILTSSIHTMKDSFEKYVARWGRVNALKLVRKHPQTLSQSWGVKEKKLDYVEKVMGRSFDEILRCPVVLRYSLEKRIIPRYELLQSIGEDQVALNTFLPISDEVFQRKYTLKDS